jgi:hypothetical protein
MDFIYFASPYKLTAVFGYRDSKHQLLFSIFLVRLNSVLVEAVSKQA